VNGKIYSDTQKKKGTQFFQNPEKNTGTRNGRIRITKILGGLLSGANAIAKEKRGASEACKRKEFTVAEEDFLARGKKAQVRKERNRKSECLSRSKKNK